MNIFNALKSALGFSRDYSERPVGAVCYHHFVLYEAVERPGTVDDSLFVAAYNEIYTNKASCGLWTRKDDVPRELSAHEASAARHYVACKERYWKMHEDLVLRQGDASVYSPRALSVFRNMQVRKEFATDF